MRYILIFIAVIISVACITGPDSPQGFSLPEGNVQAGEQAFINYECLACHTMQGYDDSQLVGEIDEKIPLGGKVPSITTYAALVTSIINPSHRLTRRLSRDKTSIEGESKMSNYNDVLTVTELIDIVSFLQPKYELQPHVPTTYGYYYFDEVSEQP